MAKDRERYAFNYYTSRGLAPHQAAGFVGNLIQESSLNTGARNPGDGRDGSDSIGIMQANGQRARNLRAFAAGTGRDVGNLDAQLDFTLHELGLGDRSLANLPGWASEAKAGQMLASAPDVASATAAGISYERPAGWSSSNPTNGHGWSNRYGHAARLAGLEPGTNTAAYSSGQGSDMVYGGAGNDDLTGGTMPQNYGGLGGLGGMTPQPEGLQGILQGPAVGDFFGALSASLLSSPRGAPLSGFGEALQARQAMTMKREAIAEERADKANQKLALKSLLRSQGMTEEEAEAYAGNSEVAGLALEQAKENKTLAYADANFPEVAKMMRAGMSGEKAVTLMSQLQNGGELTADQRNFREAQENPAFAEFMGKNRGSFRPATAEEAAAYGATAGQIGPDNRFYPNNPPTGMTVESDGKGGVRIVQGAGGKGGTFTEGQSKDNVYSTRARGALPTVDKYGDNLANYSQKLMDADPTGIVRGRYQDSDYQIARTAGDEFLQAILRKDTGAAITDTEQELYGKTYLPQPGDGEKVRAYKKQARERAIAAVEAGMSPAQMVAQERALAASGGTDPIVPGSDAAEDTMADIQPPAGIDPSLWQIMTPEERALWK